MDNRMKFTLRVFHPDKGANIELGALRSHKGAPDLFIFCLDTLHQCMQVYPGDASATFYSIPRDGSLKLYVFGSSASVAHDDAVITYYGETADADCYVYFIATTPVIWVVVAATKDAGLAKIKEAL
jgi:hypothetical protein